MTAVVLDTGALIALERRDPRMVALADEIVRARRPAYVAAGVVAQAWRGSPRQHPIVGLLKADMLRVDPMTESLAYEIGLLLAGSGTSDVIDAHVALLARRLGGTIVSSDQEDLAILAPKVRIVRV